MNDIKSLYYDLLSYNLKKEKVYYGLAGVRQSRAYTSKTIN